MGIEVVFVVGLLAFLLYDIYESIKLYRIEKLLTNNFSESDDWKEGDSVERVEWLMGTVRQQREAIEDLEDYIKRME